MAHVVSLDEAAELRGVTRHWAYCGLDCTGTLEIVETLLPRLNEKTARTYSFERALQAPCLAMMRRGVLVNTVARDRGVKELRQEYKDRCKVLDALPTVRKLWDGTELNTGQCPKSSRKDGRHKWPKGIPDTERQCTDCGASRLIRKPFNPNSDDQCARLFYELIKIKPMKNKTGKISTDADVLQRIADQHSDFADIAIGILEARGVRKQISFLTAPLTAGGRYTYSMNVGTAWTGRFSSSKSPFGLGNNLQNTAERHRSMFIADPGYELFYADLEQAESRAVAYMAGDERYIEAHKSGDVHTYVARMIWPELPWTGDLKEDKKVASACPEWDPAPGHSWRFQAKRIQHGSNYGLTPYGIARIAHIPVAEAQRAYEMYFEAFPYIRSNYHAKVREAVQNQRELENPLGRTCTLFGRPWDEHTFKQGLAFGPQSLVADVLNLALWQIWRHMDPEPIMLLGQVHDAILGQWLIEARDEAAARLVDYMTIDIPVNGQVMTIPVECTAGRNWGKASESNPHGQRVVEVH